jgi:hypothetical protein
MTRDQLKARIREGGGEGWQLPEDFDWEGHDNKFVRIVERPGDYPDSAYVLSSTNPTTLDVNDVFLHTDDVCLVRPDMAPTVDAIDAMRSLSALDREGGGE